MAAFDVSKAPRSFSTSPSSTFFGGAWSSRDRSATVWNTTENGAGGATVRGAGSVAGTGVSSAPSVTSSTTAMPASNRVWHERRYKTFCKIFGGHTMRRKRPTSGFVVLLAALVGALILAAALVSAALAFRTRRDTPNKPRVLWVSRGDTPPQPQLASEPARTEHTTAEASPVAESTTISIRIAAPCSGGLGQVAWQWAAAQFVARATGGQPCLRCAEGEEGFADFNKTFSDNVEVCPAATDALPARHGRAGFDAALAQPLTAAEHAAGGVRLEGPLRSWRYAADWRPAVRPALLAWARAYLASTLFVPQDASRVAVGVHARRKDGRPDATFFKRAMLMYRAAALNGTGQRRPAPEAVAQHLWFVVTSDDPEWFKESVRTKAHHKVHVRDPPGEPHEDFALLAACTHSVVGTSAFGWWAAAVAGGRVIYGAGADPPTDLFPPTWIKGGKPP